MWMQLLYLVFVSHESCLCVLFTFTQLFVSAAWRKQSLYHNYCLQVQRASRRRVQSCSYEFLPVWEVTLQESEAGCARTSAQAASTCSSAFISSLCLILLFLCCCSAPAHTVQADRRQISRCNREGKKSLQKPNSYLWPQKKPWKKTYSSHSSFPLQSVGL